MGLWQCNTHKKLPPGLTIESIMHFILSFQMGGKVYCGELCSYYGLLFPQTGNFLSTYPTFFYFGGITFICIFTQCSHKQLQAVAKYEVRRTVLLYFYSPIISV